MLTKKEERFLQRASSRHSYAIVTGFALCFAGGLYGVWGAQRGERRVANPEGFRD